MRNLFLTSALLALAACGAETANDATLSGTVDFDPVPASFAGMILEVRLQDVTVADAAAIEVAGWQAENITSVPVEFSMPYSSIAVSEQNSYTVNARAYTMVGDERQLLYISTQSYPVITDGWPNEVQVVVEQTGE